MVSRMSAWTPRAATESMWRERVLAWRASGERAAAFAKAHGFAPATLRWWASRVEPARAARFVRVVPRALTVVPVAEVVVEIGAARLRVTPGFDAALLAAVAHALGGAR
jgi:hypothetical protein